MIGAGVAGDELAATAAEVGRRLAEAGAVVVCGGRGGVMEAAARGAADAGGTVIGIVPGDDPADANPHCTHAVAAATAAPRSRSAPMATSWSSTAPSAVVMSKTST